MTPYLTRGLAPQASARPHLSDALRHWLEFCAMSQPKCPLFNRWPDQKRIRSERREALLTVLLILIRHLEPQSLCIGFLLPSGQFRCLEMKHIALESGLGRRRCERAISDLKSTQALEMRSPGDGQPPAMAFSPALLDWMTWESSLWAMEHDQSAPQSTSGPDGGRT